MKPYFLKLVESRIEEEEQRVLDGIKAETTSSDILFFYLMNVNHPDINIHQVTEKFLTFSEARERHNMTEIINPFLSE